jgi:hypothetical protein
MRDGKPELFRLPELNFIDDKAGKPVGINEFIGRARSRHSAIPTAISKCCNGRRFREAPALACLSIIPMRYANTPTTGTPFGRLDKALDAAAINKWVVADMKDDWNRIFAFG